MGIKPKLISLAVMQVIASAACSLAAVPVMAQQVDSDAQEQPQRVEITGSNIRRTDAETPSPVQVITAEDLKKSGQTSVAQVLQNLTSNGQGSVSSSSPWSWTPGGSGISLHGLTVGATLVLIDGHRMAPYPLFDNGQTAMVDISNIPFDAVERIEVLKDGASAIYGSDAMAGVVNVILKKSYVGTQVGAEAGTTTEGGGTTTHATFSHGFGDYDVDGYNAFINLEYRHQEQILQSQRIGDGMWTTYDWNPLGGINNNRGALTPNGPPTTQSAYLWNPNVPFSGASNSTYFYPGTACSSYAQMASNNGNGCAYLSAGAQYQPETENINLLTSFNKRLGDGWGLNVKASMFESKGDQDAGDTLPFPQSLNQSISSGPGMIPTLGGPVIPQVTVPANYPGNPFGAPAEVYGLIPGGPGTHTTTDTKSWRLVGDLTGSIGAWDIDSSLGYSAVNTNRSLIEGMNVVALQAALNRPVSPLNINGSNSAADIAAIFPQTSVEDVSEVEFAEFHANRTLGKLPGGDLGFSTGGELLHTRVNSPAPTLVANGTIGGNQAYFVGSQSNVSAYAELAAPVLKSLEIDGSVRFDHFNTDAGNTTNPKLGFKWTPSREFALRGTVATGFRAPDIAESGNSGGVTYVQGIQDPLLCPNGTQANGNPSKGAVVAGGSSSCNYGAVFMNSSNPDLKPEKSVSETIGAIFEPIKGWSSTIDLYQVRISDQVIRGTGSVADAVRGTAVPTTCADGNGGTTPCTPSVGPVLYIPVEWVNANSTQVSGLEFESHYKQKMGTWGNLNVGMTWTHEMSYILTTDGQSYQLAGTHGPEVVSNNTGNPKDRIQAVFAWEQGPLQVATTFNWISSFNLTDPSFNNATTCAKGAGIDGQGIFPNTPPPANLCQVDSFLDTDLTLRYKLDAHWTLHGNVTNLFNRQPPVDLGTWGGGWTMYNASFHQAGAVGRFVNVGANYTF